MSTDAHDTDAHDDAHGDAHDDMPGWRFDGPLDLPEGTDDGWGGGRLLTVVRVEPRQTFMRRLFRRRVKEN